MTWVFAALLTWILLWVINIQLAKIEANRFINLLVPALFGFSILILWEGVCTWL
jgi:NitT/TauT family transport system permease protein